MNRNSLQGTRKVVLFIAMSLDGFIADGEQSIGFLKSVEQEGEDYGYHAFFSTTDVVVLGRKTWDSLKLLNILQPYNGKKVFVISRSRQGFDGVAEYYNGAPAELITRLKTEQGLDIFVDGGSEIIHSLLKGQLIDRMTISVIPVLLGNGTPLFRTQFPLQNLKLLHSQHYPKGLVKLIYEVNAGKQVIKDHSPD